MKPRLSMAICAICLSSSVALGSNGPTAIMPDAKIKPPKDQPYPIAKTLAERVIAQAMNDGFDVAAIMAQPKADSNKEGHEIKNLVMTIAIPACLFIWFLIAFMWDGSSYHDLRMRYDSYQLQQSKTKVVQPEKHEEGKKPGKE